MEEWRQPLFGTDLWFVPASFLLSYRCILRNVPGVIPRRLSEHLDKMAGIAVSHLIGNDLDPSVRMTQKELLRPCHTVAGQIFIYGAAHILLKKAVTDTAEKRTLFR